MTIKPENGIQEIIIPVRNHKFTGEYLLMIWPDVDTVFFEWIQIPEFIESGDVIGYGSFRAEGLPNGSKYSMTVYPAENRNMIDLDILNSGKTKFEFNTALDLVNKWKDDGFLNPEIRKEIIFINERTEQPFKISS